MSDLLPKLSQPGLNKLYQAYIGMYHLTEAPFPRFLSLNSKPYRLLDFNGEEARTILVL